MKRLLALIVAFVAIAGAGCGTTIASHPPKAPQWVQEMQRKVDILNYCGQTYHIMDGSFDRCMTAHGY